MRFKSRRAVNSFRLGVAAAACALLAAVVFAGALGLAQDKAATSAGADAAMKAEKATIGDPTLYGEPAIEVTYPAGWHFKGGLYLDGASGNFLGPGCALSSTAVYRVTSPDGLSFVEQMPPPAWGWASGNDSEPYRGTNCFPLHGPIAAQEFARDMAAVLGVEYVADEPVPDAENDRMRKMVADANAANSKAIETSKDKPPQVKWTVDIARGIARFENGSYMMKGRLHVQVYCSVTTFAAQPATAKAKAHDATVMGRCMAGVVYLVAPEDQYAALAEQWDRPLPEPRETGPLGMGARALDSWIQARANQKAVEVRDTPESGFIENEKMLSLRLKIEHSDKVRESLAEDFAVMMKKGYARQQPSPGRDAFGDMHREQRPALPPDWVDDFLNVDVTHWIDPGGNREFFTMDLDANPNGVLAGSWVKQKDTPADVAAH